MPTDNSKTHDSRFKRRPPGEQEENGPSGRTPIVPAVPATRLQKGLLGGFYIVTALILFYLLFKAWPPQPWPTEKDLVTGVPRNIQNVITFFGRFPRLKFDVSTSLDERLFLLVIVAGAIGSYIHAATSFADYVGNRKLARSWIWWYILRPFIGVALALVFYFVVRAGFLTGGAGDVNPYGVAAMGALAGMFSKQATDKLEEIFTTIFRPAPGKGDAKRGDKLGGPSITGIVPPEGPITGQTEVTITGSGFVDKPAVTFGGIPAASVTFVNATTIKAVTPLHDSGPVEVIVTNPDGQEGSPKERFTYVATPASSNGGGVGPTAPAGGIDAAAADAVVETLDGCGLEVVDETPDEELPITEGGVE